MFLYSCICFQYIHTEKARPVTVRCYCSPPRWRNSAARGLVPALSLRVSLNQNKTLDSPRPATKEGSQGFRGLIEISCPVSQERGPANILHERPDGEYFRLCTPQPIHQLLISALVAWMQPQTVRKQMLCARVPIKTGFICSIYKNRLQDRLGTQVKVCWPLARNNRIIGTFTENADSECLARI